MREKVFRNSSGFRFNVILVMSTARLCSLNLSLRRCLVLAIYCKLQRLY